MTIIFLIYASILCSFSVDLETNIKDPLKLKDPFKRPFKRIRYSGEKIGQLLKNDKYDNFKKLKNTSLKNIRVMGVFLGENRKAILKISNGQSSVSQESYIVEEGMTLGSSGGEIKAILPGGVVVVEKIRNVFNEEEFVETIIPVF